MNSFQNLNVIDDKQKITTEIITMIENAGFEAVDRDTVYNRVESAKV